MTIGSGNYTSNIEKLNFFPVKDEKPTVRGEVHKIWTLGWNYFWSYYKWWVIGLAVLLAAAGFLTRDILENKRPVTLSGAVYNCPADGKPEEFAAMLGQYLGVNLKKAPIRLQTNLSIKNSSSYTEAGYAAEMKLEAQVAAGELDFIAGDEALMRALCRHSGNVSYLADLRVVLPGDLYGEIGDRVVWYENEKGEEIPAAVDISGSRMAEELHLQDGPVYMGILANAPHLQSAVGMIEYIFVGESDGWESRDAESGNFACLQQPLFFA